MRLASSITKADLGPDAAVFTTVSEGRLIAVVNSAAPTDPVLRAEAEGALKAAGFDPGHIADVLFCRTL